MKSIPSLMAIRFGGRPRKGAWIEIRCASADAADVAGRPRKGAWIEIKACCKAGEMESSPPQGGVD